MNSYSGSGGYSYPVSGGTVSGTASESGGKSSSYSYTNQYLLNDIGNWYATDGTGGASGTSEDYRSYSGSGSYTRTDGNTYSVAGTVDENGNDDWTRRYATTADRGRRQRRLDHYRRQRQRRGFGGGPLLLFRQRHFHEQPSNSNGFSDYPSNTQESGASDHPTCSTSTGPLDPTAIGT